MLFQSNVSLASADTAAKVESILRAFQTLPTKEEFQQATEALSATKSQSTREQHRHEITKKDLFTRNEAFSRVSQELGGANQRIADLQRQFDKYKLRMESEVTLHQRIDALASQLTGMSVQPTGPQVAVAPVPVPGTASNPNPFRDAAGSTPSVLPPSVAQKRPFSERKSATTSPGATRQQMPRLSGPPFINYVSPNNSVAKQNHKTSHMCQALAEAYGSGGFDKDTLIPSIVALLQDDGVVHETVGEIELVIVRLQRLEIVFSRSRAQHQWQCSLQPIKITIDAVDNHRMKLTWGPGLEHTITFYYPDTPLYDYIYRHYHTTTLAAIRVEANRQLKIRLAAALDAANSLPDMD